MRHQDLDTPSQIQDKEDFHLSAFGYTPRFNRVMTLFGDFSLGYSYMGPLAAIYALFAYALTTAGPASFWTLPVVLCGQFLVTLIFAESASQYPLAGGVYQWARRLGGDRWGLLTGFIYVLALLGTVSGIAAGTAPYLAQVIGVTPGPAFNAGIGVLLVVGAAATNLMGTRYLAKAAELGVWVGIAGLLLCVYLLLFDRHQPVSILFDRMGAGGTSPVSAYFAASLMGIWIFFGFEACGDIAEEVKSASTKVPRAMLLTTGAGGISALIAVMSLILAIPDINAAVSGADASPATTVLQAAFGSLGARLALFGIIILSFSGIASVMASASRLLFALGRDKVIPAAHLLGEIKNSNGLPVPAVILAGVVSVLIVGVGFWSPNAVSNIISFATAGIYVSFAMVTCGALRARLAGWKPTAGFTLGRFGLPVILAALAFQVIIIADIIWPRPATPGESFLLTNLVPISLCGIIVLGLFLILRLPASSKSISG